MHVHKHSNNGNKACGEKNMLLPLTSTYIQSITQST